MGLVAWWFMVVLCIEIPLEQNMDSSFGEAKFHVEMHCASDCERKDCWISDACS